MMPMLEQIVAAWPGRWRVVRRGEFRLDVSGFGVSYFTLELDSDRIWRARCWQGATPATLSEHADPVRAASDGRASLLGSLYRLLTDLGVA